MIIVNSALMQEEIIKLVEALDEYHYQHEKTEGIRIYFKVDTDDLEAAAKVAKRAIKSSEFGSMLYLNVVPA